MKDTNRHFTIWLFVVSVIFLLATPGLTIEINEKTMKADLEMEIRWAAGAMKNGCYVETGNVRLAGEMKSENEAVYLLFVGTTIRNNRDKNLKFYLKDFRLKVGDQILTPSAYLINTPLFVATSENPQFSIEPKKEKKVGIGFIGVPKVHANLYFNFLDLPEISFSKPPIE